MVSQKEHSLAFSDRIGTKKSIGGLSERSLSDDRAEEEDGGPTASASQSLAMKPNKWVVLLLLSTNYAQARQLVGKRNVLRGLSAADYGNPQACADACYARPDCSGYSMPAPDHCYLYYCGPVTPFPDTDDRTKCRVYDAESKKMVLADDKECADTREVCWTPETTEPADEHSSLVTTEPPITTEEQILVQVEILYNLMRSAYKDGTQYVRLPLERERVSKEDIVESVPIGRMLPYKYTNSLTKFCSKPGCLVQITRHLDSGSQYVLSISADSSQKSFEGGDVLGYVARDKTCCHGDVVVHEYRFASRIAYFEEAVIPGSDWKPTGLSFVIWSA